MTSPIAQSSKKVKGALEEFFEQCKQNPDKNKNAILQKIFIKYDLSPIECETLSHQLLKR
ncbi:MAG: hypothetical protein OCC45_14250 [Desulfotalea sp.]